MPEAQSRPSRHSTQAPFAGSQNCPRAAHALAIESHGERNLLVPTPDDTAEPGNRRVEITLR